MYYNLKYNNLLRQNPFSLSELQDPSILRKRSEPYDIFDALRPKENESATKGHSEVIILDDEDEEEVSFVMDRTKKINKNPYARSFNLKGEIFRIIRTPKRLPPPKPQVFKIIRLKKRLLPSKRQERPLDDIFDEQIQSLQKKIVTDEYIDEYTINRTIKGSVFTISKLIIIPENRRRTSRRLRSDKVAEHQELSYGQTVRVIRPRGVRQEENYVIKLHVNEDEENEDVVDTPIGLDFQVKLPPFSMGSGFRKEMKFVWNPEDEEEKEEYFSYLRDTLSER